MTGRWGFPTLITGAVVSSRLLELDCHDGTIVVILPNTPGTPRDFLLPSLSCFFASRMIFCVRVLSGTNERAESSLSLLSRFDHNAFIWSVNLEWDESLLSEGDQLLSADVFRKLSLDRLRLCSCFVVATLRKGEGLRSCTEPKEMSWAFLCLLRVTLFGHPNQNPLSSKTGSGLTSSFFFLF